MAVIHQAVAQLASTQGAAPAILNADGTPARDFAGLWSLIAGIGGGLERGGLRPGAPIGLLAEPGPDTTAELLALCARHAVAPLDARLPVPALRRACALMGLEALVLGRATAWRGAELHGALACPVLTPDHPDPQPVADGSGPGPLLAPDATCLLMTTSGTTGAPKVIGLSARNLAAAAGFAAERLGLGRGDRMLATMPPTHIHGVTYGILAPLLSGGSVAAAPRFDEARFAAWFAAVRPTWLSGAPAILRAMARAVVEADPEPRWRGVRFVRSASAALAPAVRAEVEAGFGCPVLEAYGMTEAASWISVQDPGGGDPHGTLGRAHGTELALLTEAGRIATAAARGEILLRGPNVVTGYLHGGGDPAAAFHDGWLRTGDIGELDAEGRVRIVGRIREMVNRGGEVIAPTEIEAVLLAQPGIDRAAAFGVPHPTLGEDLAAAVVARPGQPVDPEALRAAVGEALGPGRAPARIILADSLPVSDTGKLRRADLAGHFAARLAPRRTPPVDALEAIVADIFAEVVPGVVFGRDVDLHLAGGDSLSAARAAVRLEEAFGLAVTAAEIGAHPTPAALAAHLLTRHGPALRDQLETAMAELDGAEG